MKYALIGCGRISINHLKAAVANGLEIIALCDINIEQINNLIKRADYKEDVLKYTDYRQMLLEHDDIELVAIATESGLHAKIALDCIDKGINVIIEKPVALSLKDVDEIIARSKQKQVKVTVCHQNRFNQAVMKVKEAVDGKSLGRLSHSALTVRWNRNEEYYNQASWRGKWASDGGCLFNQCIHGIDLLCWLVGSSPLEVYGMVRNRQHNYLETEDLGMAVISFIDGSVATIEGTVNIYPESLEETLCLFGENGTIKLGGIAANEIDVYKVKDVSDFKLKEEVENVYGNGHARLYEDMIKAIVNDSNPLVSVIEARKVVEIILAIFKSQKEAKPIKLPLDSASSNDYRGLFD